MKLNSIRGFLFVLFALFPFTAFGMSKTAIEPATPKWGDRVRLIYNLTAAETKIHKGDIVVADLVVWYPDSVEEHFVPVNPVGDQLAGSCWLAART